MKRKSITPYDKKDRIPLNKLSKTSRTRHIYFCIDKLKEGHTRKVVEGMLLEFGINKTDAPSFVSEAMEVVANQYFTQNDLIISLHVQRYNREINKLLKKTFDEFDLPTQRRLKVDNNFKILEQLSAKENLLQLHNKNTIIRINQRNQTIIRSAPDHYLESLDFSRLTLEERLELLSLINKTKQEQNLLEGVKLSTEDKVQKEYTEFEEVKEEVPNVTQIKLENKTEEEREKIVPQNQLNNELKICKRIEIL